MATKSKRAKKSIKKAITVKGKGTNLKAAKAAPKKNLAKKTATKKKAAPKKVASKKSASTRKSVKTQTRKATPKKAIIKKKTIVREKAVTANKVEKEITEVPANLPPVEEKSPEVIPVTNSSAAGMGMDIKSLQNSKSLQNEAVRHYDNNNIRLSNKKGGIKPSGKKPLW